MRKYFLDNLRWIIILILFPFQTFRIYSFENFYIHGPINVILYEFIVFVAHWFMTLLFVIAGISTYYSFKKKTDF